MVEFPPFRQRTRRRAKLVVSAAILAAFAIPALAAPPPLSVPISSDQNADGTRASGDLLSSLQRSNFLLGDMFGLRSALSPYGITIAIQETSEVLGNVSGGYQKGAAYDGLTQALLQLDTQRAFGWHGGLFNVSALQIHGRNLSADNLGSLQTASGIEADRATRLWELWYQQKFLADDRLDIRIGLESADQEFIVNPQWCVFRQHDVRLAGGSVLRPARWRPGLSTLRASHPVPLPPRSTRWPCWSPSITAARPPTITAIRNR